VTKRVFDLFFSFLGLIFLSPVFLLVSLLIKIDSKGPVFFKQKRIGQGFNPFLIYKFRTMIKDAPQRGGPITVGKDPRITQVGEFLRKTKIDEFPQLINVFKGEMSFVGPRPEIRSYVELFEKDYEDILTVRPGITDLASLKYPDEASLLGRFENPKEAYVKNILPDKIALAKEYVQRTSFGFDLILIWKTILKVTGFKN